MIKNIKHHPFESIISVIVLFAVILITCTPFAMMILGSFKEDYENLFAIA